MRTHRTTLALGAAAGMTLATAAAWGQANPSCSDVTKFPSPIYIAGSSAIEPTMKLLALRVSKNFNTNIIFKSRASCDGPNAINNNEVLTGNANYYEPDPMDATKAVIKNCTLDEMPTRADVGVSDVTFKSCLRMDLPANIKEYQGPVQAMEFVVPKANVTTTALSFEQAGAIWGCGTKGAVASFVDETAIQQRNPQSGTQVMVATYIGLSPDAMKGKMNSATGDLITSLLAVPDPQKAIGFVAGDAYEANRSKLNALAFRGSKQTKAYYADSDANATDKRNVRDGHYAIQGPLRFTARTDAGGNISDKAKKLIGWISGADSVDPANPNAFIDVIAAAGTIPQCAMKVKRDLDGGFFEPYKPAVACGCYFELKATGKAPAECTACKADGDCSGGKKCQTGYCE